MADVFNVIATTRFVTGNRDRLKEESEGFVGHADNYERRNMKTSQ